jgi:hypothetical protein
MSFALQYPSSPVHFIPIHLLEFTIDITCPRVLNPSGLYQVFLLGVQQLSACFWVRGIGTPQGLQKAEAPGNTKNCL